MQPNIFVLSGAGLSAPSGIPTFRDADGLWEGHEVTEVATPEAWDRNAALVRRFYDERRANCESVEPNDGHRALVALQDALGADRVTLVTQNVDGLLTRAGATQVIEMHGSLDKLRCEHDVSHPKVPVSGAQSASLTCSVCGGRMRPDIVWFGEMPYQLDAIEAALVGCTQFVSVGTSGVVYPAAGLVDHASKWAHCIEVNPKPSRGPFHEFITESAHTALPKLVERWAG